MPFQKGHVKVGGRKKGSPNRIPAGLVRDACERLERMEFSAIDECVRMYKSRRVSNEHKIRLLQIICSVCYPKRLAVASNTRITHGIDRETLLRLQSNPQFARAMQDATFALEDAKVKGLLPAPGAPGPGLPILDAEPVDEPCDEPGEPGGPGRTGLSV